MPNSLEFLQSVTLFSTLDASELESLQTRLGEQQVNAGSFIFEYGQSGDVMYVIESGQIEISVEDTTGDKIVLATLGIGDIFGELSLLDPGPRSATATAVENSVLLALPRSELLKFLQAKPAAALDLLAVLARRLREADQLLMGRVTRNLNTAFEQELGAIQRLANWIAEFSGSMPFLFINAAIFFAWIVLNIGIIPGFAAFDPYPFGFLTMSVSLEAIFLSIFVLLAQNLQAAKERLRNDVEYEINLKAEMEVAALHGRLHRVHNELARRLVAIEDELKA